MRSIQRYLLILAVLGLAAGTWAKPVSKSIDLNTSARLGRVELEAGRYQVLVDGNKVTLRQGKTIVAEVEGRLEERTAKSRYNGVLLSPDGQIQEVRFAGDRRVLILDN